MSLIEAERLSAGTLGDLLRIILLYGILAGVMPIEGSDHDISR